MSQPVVSTPPEKTQAVESVSVALALYFEGGHDGVTIYANGSNQASVVVKYQVRDDQGRVCMDAPVQVALINPDTKDLVSRLGWRVSEQAGRYRHFYKALPGDEALAAPVSIKPADASLLAEDDSYRYERFYLSHDAAEVPITTIGAAIEYRGKWYYSHEGSDIAGTIRLGLLPKKSYQIGDLTVSGPSALGGGPKSVADDYNWYNPTTPNDIDNYWRRVDFNVQLTNNHEIVSFDTPPGAWNNVQGGKCRGYYLTDIYVWPIRDTASSTEQVWLWDVWMNNGQPYWPYTMPIPVDRGIGIALSFITKIVLDQPTANYCNTTGRVDYGDGHGTSGKFYINFNDLPYYAELKDANSKYSPVVSGEATTAPVNKSSSALNCVGKGWVYEEYNSYFGQTFMFFTDSSDFGAGGQPGSNYHFYLTPSDGYGYPYPWSGNGQGGAGLKIAEQFGPAYIGFSYPIWFGDDTDSELGYATGHDAYFLLYPMWGKGGDTFWYMNGFRFRIIGADGLADLNGEKLPPSALRGMVASYVDTAIVSSHDPGPGVYWNYYFRFIDTENIDATWP